MSLFDLRGATLKTGSGTILEPTDLVIRDGAVTVLMGPAGTGKSTLLATLAGTPPPGTCRLGVWKHRDLPLAGEPASVTFVPQRPRGRAGDIAWSTVSSTLLLDEPNVGLGEDETQALVSQLRLHVSRGAAVVITHDLSFARRIADDVIFLCARAVHGSGEATRFFDSPPNELAARFLRDGNCWPAPDPVSLPSHFRWIIPERLAGMGRPGLLRDEEEDLAAIASASISLLVSLTEEAFPLARLRAFGIQGRHVAIQDMGVPAIGPTAQLCRDIVRTIDAGDRVAVHCQAGLGRTGTVLAAVLTWLGRTPEEAILEVRSHNPRYIQNRAQADFVQRFAETCGLAPPVR